jgi:hypothetical protein
MFGGQASVSALACHVDTRGTDDGGNLDSRELETTSHKVLHIALHLTSEVSLVSPWWCCMSFFIHSVGRLLSASTS